MKEYDARGRGNIKKEWKGLGSVLCNRRGAGLHKKDSGEKFILSTEQS